MELMLAVLILVALVACWVILPAEKREAHSSSQAPKTTQTTQRA